MATLVYSRLIGYNKAKWFKTILLALLGLFLFFGYPWLSGLLGNTIFGVNALLAKVVAVLFAFMAWDAHYTG